MNAHGVGEVALAGATSNLFAMLADSYRRSKRIQPGDEIIVHDSSHEVLLCHHTVCCEFHGDFNVMAILATSDQPS